jgi:hypothetical protein
MLSERPPSVDLVLHHRCKEDQGQLGCFVSVPQIIDHAASSLSACLPTHVTTSNCTKSTICIKPLPNANIAVVG